MKFHSDRYILLAVSLLLSLASHAIPSRPNPQRLVNDYARVFTREQAASLERMLVAFDDSTSNQIAVVTVTDLEGYAPAEYATRIGLKWQVGSEKFDNGIVLLVKPKTVGSAGQVFIAVGYGLEGAIPDAYAKRIIDNELIPHFMHGDYFEGVESACEVLMKLASGEISDPGGMDDDVEAVLAIFVLFFIGLVVIVLIFKGGSHGGSGGGGTIYRGPIITTGTNYGGYGGYGGGFGGGFGGFGGGSFGGGGAGGSW